MRLFPRRPLDGELGRSIQPKALAQLYIGQSGGAATRREGQGSADGGRGWRRLEPHLRCVGRPMHDGNMHKPGPPCHQSRHPGYRLGKLEVQATRGGSLQESSTDSVQVPLFSPSLHTAREEDERQEQGHALGQRRARTAAACCA